MNKKDNSIYRRKNVIQKTYLKPSSENFSGDEYIHLSFFVRNFFLFVKETGFFEDD